MKKKKHTETDNLAITPPTNDTGANEEAPTAARMPAQNKAAIAFDILDKLPRFKSPTGRKFVVIDGAAVSLRRSEPVREFVSAEYHRITNATISESAIEEAVLAISGQPLETREAHVRVGGTADRIVVDLVTDNKTAIIRPEGVTVERADVPFARPPGTASLVVPEVSALNATDAAGAFQDFYNLLGIDDVYTRASIGAFIVQAMRPRGPFAMLIVRGVQGSGKTTVTRQIRRLLDPREPEDVEVPHNTRFLAIHAEHSHLLAYDNLSTLDQRLSDAFCRIATGSGFVTRALRTDRDLAAFRSSRPIVFTSIGDVGVAPDLLDRALIVTLPGRKDRKPETHLDAQFDALRPRLLAAVLYAVHVALQGMSKVAVPGEIRMMDAACFAVAAEPVLGLPPGSIVKAFLASRAEAAVTTATDSVVARTLDVLETRNPWTGSLEELLDALHGSSGSSRSRAVKDLPNNARALRARLDRVAGALRHLDVTMDFSQLHATRRTRIVVLKRAGAKHTNGHGNGTAAILA